MKKTQDPIRVLYSFPHKIGAGRICYTAWQQVAGLNSAGVQVLAHPGAVQRALPPGVRTRPTLARGRLRIPYRLLGTLRACALHDWVVARRLRRLAGQIDLVHAWALGSLQTLRVAKQLGIPTVLERPNAHTRFAYEIVRQECDRIGVPLPPNHEHAFNRKVLAREELEYDAAKFLLCPCEFVVKTFLDHGVPAGKLLRHTYGFDENRFFPDTAPRDPNRPLTMIFVGVCAVRKGLHFALDAWLNSPASRHGRFLIAGGFLPAYQAKLAPQLSHPSVEVLGHREDVPELMRKSDILVLPSIEEGFGLVIAEAMGSGCVPLVSDACADIAMHGRHGFVHRAGDVETLSGQITRLHENRALLRTMRQACIDERPNITWEAAGRQLADVYRLALAGGTDSGSVRMSASASI